MWLYCRPGGRRLTKSESKSEGAFPSTENSELGGIVLSLPDGSNPSSIEVDEL